MRNVLLFVLTLSAPSLCFGADVYPNKPVRIIVPFSPGGTSDLTARVISLQLSEQLGQTFVVDNRIGASGIIGHGIVAKAAPDGYTLATVDTGFTIVPNVKKSLPYAVPQDFTLITQIIGVPRVLVVPASMKVETLREFIALAQASPGKLNYGSGGAGGINHLAAELFNLAAKVKLAHVPYKGAGAATAAVVGGQVEMTLAAGLGVVPLVKGGRLRALAVTTADGKRYSALPEVPSMGEAGVSGMELNTWFGLTGPAGMPKAVVNKLHSEVVKALSVQSVKDRFQGSDLMGSSPEEFSRAFRADLQLWSKVVKAAGVTPE